MYQTVATHAAAFTPPPSPQPEPVRTIAPPVGFADSKGRCWPMAISDSRIGAALRLGIDLVAAAKNPATLFAGTGSVRTLRVATAIAVVVGFDDSHNADGVTIGGETFTPERFARVIAEPKVFKAALEALTLCLTDFANSNQ